jgi:FkbM family methyltransferase
MNKTYRIKRKNDPDIDINFYIEGLSIYDLCLVEDVLVRDEYKLYSRTKPDPLVFIDIGAHAGSFAVLTKFLYPQSRVYCFEPNPLILPILKKNVEPLGIVVYPFAISENQLSWLSVPSRELGPDMGASCVIKEDNQARNRKSYKIDSISINDAINLTGEKEIGYIKMDCEGSEWDIIDNISQDNINKLHYIIGEWHNGFGVNFLRICKEKLINFNFQALTDPSLGQGLFEGVKNAI